MDVKSGYKQTEVGVIPEDWSVAQLGQCLQQRPTYGINAPALPYSHRLPTYVRITDITEEGRLSSADRVSVRASASAQYYLSDGDIVFARTGASVGKSYRYRAQDGPLVYAGFLIQIRVNPALLLPEFLAGYAHTAPYWQWVRLMSMRSGQPGINGQEYAQLPIPTPPLHEQRAIATALSDVDDLLTSLDRLIAKKRAIKQGVMHDLLTGRKRLPGFSGEWEVRRLGDHLRVLRNGVNSRAELQDEGEIRYLHYGDIHGHTTHHLNPANLPFLPTYKAASLDKLSTGDLVFADASEDLMGVGKSVEILPCDDTSVVSGQHTIALRFDKTILADGFKGLLQFVPEFLAHLRRHAAGTKVLATNRAFIMSAEVLLPPPTEQAAIATLISELETEITALQARRDKTHAIKQAMMHELLTGRTRLI